MQLDLPEVDGVAFRLLPGFTIYAVGDNGTVWSKATRGGKLPEAWRQVSMYRRPYGARYFVVCLRENDGKGKVICRYVHRLVLGAFVGPAPKKIQCCHFDGDTANNNLANLRWDTHTGNTLDKMRHGRVPHGENHVFAKLTDEKVIEARRLWRSGWTTKRIARKYGVSLGTMQKVLDGVTWKHVPDIDLSDQDSEAESGLCFTDEPGTPTAAEWLEALASFDGSEG